MNHISKKHKISHFKIAIIFYLLARSFDIVVTTIYCSKYGTAFEANTGAKILMEKYGIFTGLILVSIPNMIIILGLGYIINKFTKKSFGSFLIYLYAIYNFWGSSGWIRHYG